MTKPNAPLYACQKLWLAQPAKPGRSAHLSDIYEQIAAGAQLTDEQVAMLADIDRAIERGEVSRDKPAERDLSDWVEHVQPDWTDALMP